jgi:hypothetical protein
MKRRKRTKKSEVPQMLIDPVIQTGGTGFAGKTKKRRRRGKK